MKTITATKFMRGNTKAAYDEVCTHSPVLITSDDRPDIVMVLANDYGDLLAKNEKLEKSHSLLMMFVKDGYKSLSGKPTKKTGIALFNYVNSDKELSRLVNNSDYAGVLKHKINN